VESKDIIGFLLLAACTLIVVVGVCLSPRARDAAFFFMIAGIVVSDRMDINFFSHFWYRGTTRGLEISLVDIAAFGVFISSFLMPRYGESRWKWPAGFGFMLLFFFYCAASLVFTEPRVFGLFELSKMVRGLIFFLAAFTFVRSEREVRLFILALCCTACFEGVLCLRQRWLMHLDRVAGSLDHSNSLSVYLCLIGPILVAAVNSSIPRWLRWACALAIPAAVLSVVLTVSRAGVPIFFLTVFAALFSCMSWRITATKIATALLVVLGLGGMSYFFWDNLKERYQEATLKDEYLNEKLVENRGYYLRLASVIVEDRFFGVGLNNWSYWVSERYGARIDTPYHSYNEIPSDLRNTDDNQLNFAAPAHNLAALTVGELGVPGLALFLLLWLRWFQMGATFYFKRGDFVMRQLALGVLWGMVGVFLQSVTEWSFRHTPVFLTFHAVAGVLATLYVARRSAEPEPEVEAPESEEWVEREFEPAEAN
jgi:hypothetical protein